MRSYFVPRKLLVAKSAYIAALHSDEYTAREALQNWTRNQHPDDLTYPHHKLAMMVYARFKNEQELIPHFGIYENIHRHCLLRAHVNLSVMNELLAKTELDGLKIFAIGGTRQKINSPNGVSCDLELIEWGTDREGGRQTSKILTDLGAVLTNPARKIIGRGAEVQSFKTANNCTLRLVVFNKAPDTLTHQNTMPVMSNQAHLDFITSRQASLTARRDQFVFDFHDLLFIKDQKKPIKIRFSEQNKQRYKELVEILGSSFLNLIKAED